MFKYVKKTIFILGVVLFILPISAYAEVEETFAEITESLAEVNEDFNALAASSLEEAAVIDNSIKEISKAIEFVQESLEGGDPDLALKAVTFVNKSLSDISATLPKSYESDMSNADMKSLGEEMMEEITNVTTGLAAKKEKDTAKMITTMLDVTDAGFNAFEISKNLNSFGVDTIKVNLDIKTREEMSTWTKEEWETAWTGGVLTDDGKQIITDEEAKQRLDALNAQLGLVDEKNKIIEEKNNLKQKTQKELNVLRDQLNDLNKQKTNTLNPLLDNQAELDKQIKSKQKEIDEANSLITQYNEDITNIDKQIENIQSQTSKIDEINSEIKTLTVNGDTLNKQTNELKNQILENNTRITQLQRGLEGRIAVANSKKTKFESWHHNTITYEGRRVFDATLSNISNEQNISIDLANLTDAQRIEYYNQYQSTFDAVKTWPNTTNKSNVTDNLKLDGTASGFIERQKKVLDLEREYLAWEKSVPQNREEISTKIAENNKINLEITGLQDQIQQNENLVNIKKTELSATEIGIQKISLNDPRRAELDSLQSEKIETLTKVDGKIQNLNQEIELNQNKINSNLSNINSFQAAEIELNQKLDYLNKKLESATLQKDFATAKSKQNIKKEVEALNNFGHILVKSYGEDIADVEIEFALKQTDIILSGDSKKHQIFDFERYGAIAGLSQGVIDKGKAAINNNDWNTQKEVYSQLYKSLSTNKNYNVDVPSAAELNVMVAEQKLENEIVDLIKSNPTNINFNPDVSPVYWPKGGSVPTSLTEAFNSTYDQILKESGLDEKLQELEKKTNAYKEYMNRDWIKDYKDYDLTKALNLQREKNTLFMDVSSLQSKASQQARDIAWEENNKTREAHVNAVNELNKMIDDKLATLPQYSEEKINTVKAIVSRLSPDSSYLAIDPSSDKIAAEAKAALYDDDGTMLKAYNIANDTGTKSVTYDTQGVGTIRSLASYKSDKTNVELAAEIQSTLDGTYTSDNINGYMAAKYGQGSIIEKIPRFTSKEEKEVNKELSKIFSENITSTSAVKKEIKSIENEIKSVQSEKIDITKNIQGLNEEIEKINSSEQQIQKQIVELNSDLRQKEGLFKEKEKAITDNINEISAIEFQIEQLQSQKSEVESKINLKSSEIEGKLAEVTKTENEVKTISNELLSKQSEFDTQINQLQESRKPLLNVTTSLVNELRELNKEVDELEKAKPIYEKQIVELKDEIEKLNNTKADLATAQAQTIGLEVDEKTIKSIPKMEDTAIIALNGPALVRVVDDAMLVEQAEAFKAPISEFAVNAQIFTAAAVRPEELFAVKNITGEIKVALSEGTVKEIGSGSLGIKIDSTGVGSTKTASIDKSATMTDAVAEKISTSDSMNTAKRQNEIAASNLREVSSASTTLSSVSAADMEISGDYSKNYGFNNKATAKAVAATKTATTAASSSRAAATEAATAAEAAQESAQAAAQAAAQAQEAAQAAATEAAQAAAAAASRQAAEAAATQAAQAAAAAQAQQAALAAATQATTAAATVAAQAAATNEMVAVQGASKQAALHAAEASAAKTAAELRSTSIALNVEAAKSGATEAQKAAAAEAAAISTAAQEAKQAAEGARMAAHNAISMASVQAKAAAATAVKEAAAAAALAIQDATNEAAQAAAAAAAAASVNSEISAINARIAEMQSAMEDWKTEANAEKLLKHGNEEISELEKKKEALENQ